ncbi:MAG TPA: asparaginase [Fermentimonas caenicola]|jgi:L-asparaginase|uniref:asparaginase n=1 Tax=Fermentimonas caenicola TaxID=1562970 RepID=A0A098BWJ2_9BACT|nr:asparaginase [Lascolabacillus sp.]MBP6174917.1 asparaginase [Fermentimonas sp.]TAH60828.1 MAG: asparaginase [Fermentimonas caenicola]MBP6196977.1 asparaginase [Fermentimonas sp.]MBP7104645.1 asparaginase [Fermentimonas sp.]MCK9500558.1 asparaginase [Lascolabacillus sp.]
MIDRNANVLLIYTGGTIGMLENKETGALEPFDFSHLRSNIPEMKKLNFNVESYQFNPPIDSSDVTIYTWQEMLKVIETHYHLYDGFVILHGTDTMAFTASALSFMCENLTKPVILTGSQLPIGKLRSDAKENLITALEIAADKNSEGRPKVPEMSVYMQNLLMRGNRTTKLNADNFSAFTSPNCTYLAESGLDIKYNTNDILKPDYNAPVKYHYNLNPDVVILKLFPGITEAVVKAHLEIPGLKGVVLETFGTGNSPIYPWFMKLLSDAIERGIVIVNVTQCMYGNVEMYRYENGRQLEKLGVISGHDITTEAAVTKMMSLFGNCETTEEVKQQMQIPLRGEMSPYYKYLVI